MKKTMLSILFALVILFQTKAQHYKLFVGTFTRANNSEGIYLYDFDTANAETKALGIIKSPADQGYLALSSNQSYLYSTYMLKDKSAITAYGLDANNATSHLINQQATGKNPCYVITDGTNVLSANYHGGNINVFGLNEDGSLTAEKQFIQHTGSGPDSRQASAHVHQVVFSPDKKFVLANDLGDDQIHVYQYQAIAKKPLTLKHTVKTDAGSGPRHLSFSPNGKFVYLTHEFNGKISVFSYDKGNLKLLQQIGTTSEGFSGVVDGADIHISSDGKFLYQSNRGDANTLSVFSINKKGLLSLVEIVSCLGKGPRNFSLDPSGKFVLVANQFSNDIVIFNRDSNTGKLRDSGKRINVGMPVCLVFGN